jgi:hypothetical protein
MATTTRRADGLVCDICDMVFKNRTAKCRHKKTCAAVQHTVVTNNAADAINIIDNSTTTIINNHVDNSVTIAPVINIVVNSFGSENLDLVEKFMLENPAMFTREQMKGKVDALLWLATHKEVPSNDNICSQYEKSGFVKVLIDGEKRNVPAKEVYSQMAANNDRLIQSKAAPEIRLEDRFPPRLPGGKQRTHTQLAKIRAMTSSALLKNGWGPSFDKEKNPLQCIPPKTCIHPGPYPDVAKYFALKHIPNIQSDISEYVEIFAPICKYAGVHYNNEWWETTEVNLNGKQLRVIINKISENAMYEKLLELIENFRIVLLNSSEFTCSEEYIRKIRNIYIEGVCHQIRSTM